MELATWWLWIYEFQSADLPVIFKQENVRLPWLTTELSERRVEILASQIPVTVDPLERDPRIQLDIRHAAFPVDENRLRAEAYFSIARADPFISRETRWTNTAG